MRRIIAAIALLVGLSFAGFAQAQDEAALDISPTSGGCGTSIDVSGSGFPADSDVIVVAIPDVAIGLEFEEPAATTDADGEFQVTIAVPDDPAACPGNFGSDWIVFACAGALCEPRLSVPFNLTAMELPDANVRICVRTEDMNPEEVVRADVSPMPEGATVEIVDGCAALSNFPAGTYHLVLETTSGLIEDDITLAAGDEGTIGYMLVEPIPGGLPMAGMGWQSSSDDVASLGWSTAFALFGVLLVSGSAFALVRDRRNKT